MNNRKRFLYLWLIMTAVALVVASISNYIVYQAAFEEERERLVETVQSQARLIEAVARFDAIYSNDYPGGSYLATVSQIIDAHKNYKGFGETGEFTLARLVEDSIVFLLSHRHHDLDQPHPVPFLSENAQPMQQALSGKSGTMVGLDYRGEKVLAAYEPVAMLDLGLVAKIDLSEIRTPFIRASLIAFTSAVMIVLIGSILFLRISNPVLRRLQEYSRRLEGLVKERTAELTATNEQLRVEITECKQAEETLRESENKYSTLFELASDAFLTVSLPDGKIIDVNEAAIRMLGYSKEELREFSGRDIIALEVVKETERQWQRQVEEKGYFLLETIWVRKDGSQFPVEISGKPFDIEGQVFFQLIGRDVTERKRAESGLRNIAEGVSAATGAEFFHSLVQYLSDTLELDYAFVGELDSDKAESIKTIAVYNHGNFVDNFTYKLVNTPCDKVIGQQSCIYLNGVQQQFPKDRLLAEMKVESYVGSPLFDSNGNAIGLLVVLNAKPLDNPELVKSMLQIFAIRASAELERKRVVKTLLESEERYRIVAETATDAIISINEKSTILFTNPAAEKIFGYTSAEMIGQQITMLMDKSLQDIHLNSFKQYLNTGKRQIAWDTVELSGLRKDGKEIPLEISFGEYVEREKRVFTAIIRDITKQKRTELLQSALYRIATVAHSDTSLEDLFRSIHEIVADIMEASNFYIALYDPQKDLMTFPYFVDEVDTYEGPYKPQNGLTEYVIQTGKTLLLNEKDRHKLIRQGKIRPVGEPSRIWLGVPLKSGSKTFGAIVVQHYTDVNAFGEREKEMLTFISEQIAIVIERKQAEEEVKKLSEVVEQSSDMVFITDINSRIDYVNPAFEKITGYNKEEALGQTPRILKSGKMSAEYYKKVWDTIKSGEVMHAEVIDRKKNGELFIYDQTITPVKNADGDIVNFISTGKDITERVKSRKELEKALEKAKEGERVKSLFLANMSHEIRTPLNAILGFTDLIEASTHHLISEEEKEFFEAIKKSGNRLMRTVHEILDISQIEAGTYDLNLENIELCDLVREIVNEHRTMAEEKSLTLECTTDLDSAFIQADKYSVSQAISNLIDNAIKYTEQGKIAVVLKRSSEKYVLSIQDTGIGISTEYIDNLYSVFSQESEGYTKKFQGVGLGLAIAKRNLDLNRVDINVESTKGEGTIFTLTFKPVKKPITKKQVKKEAAPATQTPEPIEKPLVLVVEDDLNSQKLTAYFLKGTHHVCFAVSVEEAKQQLKKCPVGLVLLDLSLNGSEDGLDLVRWIRKTKAWQKIPVIATTAHAFTKDRDNCLAAGCDDYLAKPVKREKLLEKINAFV